MSEATFLSWSQIYIPLKQFDNFTFSVHSSQMDKNEGIKKLYYC